MEMLVREMQRRIYFVRGTRVMLDSDLARFYGMPTKQLTRTIRRNSKWFPEEFVFQLSQEEYDALKRASGALILPHGEHRKYLPLVFTQQGSAMLLHFVHGRHEVRMALVKAIFPVSSPSEIGSETKKPGDEILAEIRDEIRQLREQKRLAPVEVGQITIAPKFSNKSRKGYQNLEAIQNAVASYYEIKVQDLKSKNRSRTISLPRQVAMYLLRKKAGISLDEIGAQFGERDHTTILYGVRKIETALENDPEMRESINAIQNQLSF